MKFKTVLLYFIGFSSLVPVASAKAAFDCRAVLQGLAKSIGIKPPRQNRPIQAQDAELMAYSYAHLEDGQPREAGVVTLLGSNGEVLAQTELGLGGVGWVNLNVPTIELLNENIKVLKQVKTISITHTHPRYLGAKAESGRYTEFSKSDLKADLALFQELKQFPELMSVTLESSIVFLKADDGQNLQEGIPAEKLKSFLSIKSYQLEK